LPEEQNEQENHITKIGAAVAVGIGGGVALGVAMENMAIGIAIGIGNGIAAAFGMRAGRARESDITNVTPNT